MRSDAIKTAFSIIATQMRTLTPATMHGRVMIEVKVGKGKHKPQDSQGFGPNSVDCRLPIADLPNWPSCSLLYALKICSEDAESCRDLVQFPNRTAFKAKTWVKSAIDNWQSAITRSLFWQNSV
jgi:hypothetical protein